ncbi:MAG: hypothetical protein Q8P72_00295 [Candidatus Roizmanbacteria bacterium]|nr:hypothetical protein [Candidatus Roizmanbacteria bacterium]
MIGIDGYGPLCRIHTGQLINECDLFEELHQDSSLFFSICSKKQKKETKETKKETKGLDK